MHQSVHICIAKFAMTRTDYHDISQLLLLAVIAYHNTILIIAKENIMINRQNQLTAHP